MILCDGNSTNKKLSEKAMVWSTQSKSLDITSTKPYKSIRPNVLGRALSNKTLKFTPAELFAAAARSSHLHKINFAPTTPESVLMARLIELHVDDTSLDFAITDNADNLKDYVKSYFVGTVAAGLAYLTMINEGYVWSDHFENVGGGAPKKKRKPDYVFSGPTTGLALMEAKGARSGTSSGFIKRVRDGYKGQVEPHLGHKVGGQIAVRGYSIGAWMKSTNKAELLLHHTAAPPQKKTHKPTQPTQPTVTANSERVATAIQKNSFATAFALAHSPMLANSIRHGGALTFEDDAVPFLRFRWLDHYWLSRPPFPISVSSRKEIVRWFRRVMRCREWSDPFLRPQMFAIHYDIGRLALCSFLNDRGEMPFRVVDNDLREQARTYDREGARGAVLPDGLALIGSGSKIYKPELVFWRRGESDFESM